MARLHPLDFAVLLVYLVAVFYLARRSAGRSSTSEGFLLAGRKLGKVYQFFLNFGNSTDANGAVSTASLVYQQGVSGVWMGFQMVFLNPYYWFMNLWFRRARLVTTAELFEERLGSPWLARFYAVFQIVSSVVITIGFGNLVSYKVAASLLPDAELSPWMFYVGYTAVIGGYVVIGGLAATAMNEIIQGLLTLIFSGMLIPLGFAALGGTEALARLVPEEAFHLIGQGGPGLQITFGVLLGILANALVQANGIPGNMTISGAATNEFAARFGAVTGTFAKRLLTIMWAFSGLIAIALFQGENALADPDAAWGTLSRQLLVPGLLGLMLVGLLANSMDTAATQTMSVSGLFVTNVYQPLRGGRASERECVAAGRASVVAVLALGIAASLSMKDVFSMLQFMMTVNVPFGAAVMLMFFWRRLTAPAVWTAVTVAILFNTLLPAVLPHLDAVRAHPGLTATATVAGVPGAAGVAGAAPQALYFDVLSAETDTPGAPVVGSGRLHLELVLLDTLGVDVAAMSASDRYAARLFLAVATPFVLLLLVSLCTRQPPRERVAAFYGKMKTPVAATPEIDEQEMATTRRDPYRFDHTKLFPRSNWEFTKWNRLDLLGFLACCAVTASIIALFWGLLRLASPD